MITLLKIAQKIYPDSWYWRSLGIFKQKNINKMFFCYLDGFRARTDGFCKKEEDFFDYYPKDRKGVLLSRDEQDFLINKVDFKNPSDRSNFIGYLFVLKNKDLGFNGDQIINLFNKMGYPPALTFLKECTMSYNNNEMNFGLTEAELFKIISYPPTTPDLFMKYFINWSVTLSPENSDFLFLRSDYQKTANHLFKLFLTSSRPTNPTDLQINETIKFVDFSDEKYTADLFISYLKSGRDLSAMNNIKYKKLFLDNCLFIDVVDNLYYFNKDKFDDYFSKVSDIPEVIFYYNTAPNNFVNDVTASIIDKISMFIDSVNLEISVKNNNFTKKNKI